MPQRLSSRFARLGLLSLLTLLLLWLGGCATSTLRLAYGQADTLIYWRLDSYLDFSSEQAPRVRESLARFMDWHRRTQLPLYAQELRRLQPMMAQAEISPEQACQALDQVRSALEPALLNPRHWSLLWLANELSAEQLQHLERKQRLADEKWRGDWLEGSSERRREQRWRRSLERAEMLYGRLDEPQRAALREGLAQASSFDAQRSFAARQERQRQLLQLLRHQQQERLSPEQSARAMQQYLEHALRGHPTDGAQQRYLQAVQREGCASFARLHRSTTATQREHARRVIASWADDFSQLAAR